MIIAALIGALIEVAASLAGRVLIGLGFGFATYTGFSAMLDWALAQSTNYLQSVPSDVAAIMGAMKVDICVSMLFSACSARLLISGLQSGSIKKLVTK
ncbi:hypothetical protein GCM10007350_14330 [Jeongeupia chitinilytica]|uniref:DUF2523 domain-containing protein n=2 Tax=Jeongeupia chitinilytica TaxID=1041641 RepID=A0ABQ3GYK8_9NEIS|nr:hypothetical protein GCM10007350_14330 [Jeongeupia chitinilytica]